MGGLVLKMVSKTGTDDCQTTATSAFNHTVNNIDGLPVKLSDLKSMNKSKAVIFVNVAQNWGLTDRNYKQLTALHSEYASKGLNVYAFPCN